ncbi:hypothetical protein MHL39_10810 [Roseomonas mucosa]|uniref:hypothetical protein n=1 Tax=Roseomonas mucosa TaxID=207340 RepID=UPI001EF62736|nr:hypothetical protein [Roseomonas mucosa]MCG7357129.1 hypothetical protein [Roseomonas mucosa]
MASEGNGWGNSVGAWLGIIAAGAPMYIAAGWKAVTWLLSRRDTQKAQATTAQQSEAASIAAMRSQLDSSARAHLEWQDKRIAGLQQSLDRCEGERDHKDGELDEFRELVDEMRARIRELVTIAEAERRASPDSAFRPPWPAWWANPVPPLPDRDGEPRP